MTAKACVRVLALQPTARGLGYALFDGDKRLLDCGAYETRSDKNSKCLAKAETLLALGQPQIVALENVHASGARRKERIVTLIARLSNTATARACHVEPVSRLEVHAHFAGFGTGSKDDVAVAVAALYPELKRRLPPRRRPWQAEHPRMVVFEAAAMGIVAQTRHLKETA